MVNQPATRRLLTEAAAALVYRTAAQVDTQADARIAAKRGAANGVAALGADGLVPASQLPPAANVPSVARLTGAGFFGTSLGTAASLAAATPVTGLALTGLTPGVWEVVLDGCASTSNAIIRGYLAATGGLVAADSQTTGAAATTAAQSSRFFGQYAGNSAAVAPGMWQQSTGGSTAMPVTGSTSVVPFRWRGFLRVATGGGLAVRIDTSSTSNALIDTGSFLSAVLVG